MADIINPNEDITGNAPMIPRSKFIEVLNKIQELQTQILVIINQYEPSHFKETEARQPKVSQPVWSSDGSGLPEQSMVSTFTGQ